MENNKQNLLKRRCKSLSSLQIMKVGEKLQEPHQYTGRSRTSSESSAEVFVANDTDSDSDRNNADSGIDRTIPCDDIFTTLEQKVEKLSQLFSEQENLLSSLKEEIRNTKTAIAEKAENDKLINDLFRNALAQSTPTSLAAAGEDTEESDRRARNLIAAIEQNGAAGSLEAHLRDAFTAVLDSEEMKERMVSATSSAVRELVHRGVCREVASLFAPALERSQRRLLRHVSKLLHHAFIDMEEDIAAYSKAVTHKSSVVIYRALEQHRRVLEAPPHVATHTLHAVVDNILKKELTQWRMKVLNIISEKLCDGKTDTASEIEEIADDMSSPPPSPQQPVKPGTSIIDHLMRSAIITKLIKDGHTNAAFKSALSADDLSLVMIACRAVAPAAVFAEPCHLDQPVILSLVQQLVTDMVHETRLKCRYLEEAIIYLKTVTFAIRSHLLILVGEVRKHLTAFLMTYRGHVASRNITLIIMAADNLLY